MYMLCLAAAAIGMQVLGGASQAKSQAQAQKFQNQMAAMKAKSDARIAEINAAQAARDTVSNQMALEQQVMAKAMQDGAAMAATKISHAGSGVAMNSASRHEERANQQLMHVVSMGNAEVNRVQALNNDQMTALKYRTDSIINRAGAVANSILADAQHPNRVFAQSLLTGGLAGAAQYAVMSNAYTQTEAVKMASAPTVGDASWTTAPLPSASLSAGPVQSNYGISMGGIPSIY